MNKSGLLARCLLLLVVLMAVRAPEALAHGTTIEMTVADGTSLELNAVFDTGEPMSEAQILVYNPEDPRNAWHTGVADEAGFYSFDIDASLEGRWSISVRTAGHGEILYFNVAANGAIELEESAGRPLWQTISGAAAVLIGLGGIAYWYSRPKKNKQVEVTHARS